MLTQGQVPARPVPSFKTGVDLVSLAVTVTDEGARYLPGLLADDFAYIINHCGAKVVCAHSDHIATIVRRHGWADADVQRRKDDMKNGRQSNLEVQDLQVQLYGDTAIATFYRVGTERAAGAVAISPCSFVTAPSSSGS